MYKNVRVFKYLKNLPFFAFLARFACTKTVKYRVKIGLYFDFEKCDLKLKKRPTWKRFPCILEGLLGTALVKDEALADTRTSWGNRPFF
ncbi:hypothetical protein [Algibacter sp. 2305UL17-15]|uniref:hypothetical protein n=1 Tax=Algibacter sp. 2305UL17-15 TaxID=3231268 RepID=UPI00345761D7